MKSDSTNILCLILLLLFGFATNRACGQITLSNSVIGSAGASGSNGTISLDYTVGEPVVFTGFGSSVILTQGFHQPTAAAGMSLVITVAGFNATCQNSKDGYAVAIATGGTAPYTFSWSPEGGTSTGMIDTTSLLSPGNYTVFVTDVMGNSGFAVVDIGYEYSTNCDLYLYTGFSPNGDGSNDTWLIDGVAEYSENKVTIYNRWGDIVWSANNYDNKNVVWDGSSNSSGQMLPAGSYFYTVELSDKVHKGWVQLTR